jgi:hypothetical protein
MDNFDFLNVVLEKTKDEIAKSVSNDGLKTKTYEDNIFKSISLCTDSQRDFIINQYNFIYYKSYNRDRSLVKTRILNEERNNKLKEILK